jgi:hypothetical protein
LCEPGKARYRVNSLGKASDFCELIPNMKRACKRAGDKAPIVAEIVQFLLRLRLTHLFAE